MVNKKLIGIVIAVIVVVGVSAAFFGGVFADNTKADFNSVKSGVTKDCSSTPWVVAQQKGFFKKYGVNFTDVGEIAPPQQNAAFLSGQTNVVDNHPNNIINLIKSGAKIKAVAVSGAEPVNQTEKYDLKYHMHYLVKEGGLLNSTEDLKNFKEKNGRKIKIAVGATGICSDLEANAYFRKLNISKDDYEFVVLADNQQEQALQQGSIDIASLHPPFFLKAEKDGGVGVLFTSTDAFGDAAGMTLLCFSEEYIEKYPGTIRDFINAFKDAERWSNEHRDEAGELTAKFIDLPYTSNVHWYSPSGAFDDVSIGYLQQWIDAMVIDGQLKEGEFTPEDLYTTKFQDTWKTDLPDN
jgi:ABC-type nitrate/sulfonate/bicarbonate transport system substrate-binding protein